MSDILQKLRANGTPFMSHAVKLTRTNSSNADFAKLVRLLDQELAHLDGEEHSFYAQYNKIDLLTNTVVAYVNAKPVACGAFKSVTEDAAEIKRMYVVESMRGKGLAGQVLSVLEQWAKELSFQRCVLETGKRQPDAIALYTKHGYYAIPNYGPYVGVENSVCFEKRLSD